MSIICCPTSLTAKCLLITRVIWRITILPITIYQNRIHAQRAYFDASKAEALFFMVAVSHTYEVWSPLDAWNLTYALIEGIWGNQIQRVCLKPVKHNQRYARWWIGLGNNYSAENAIHSLICQMTVNVLNSWPFRHTCGTRMYRNDRLAIYR